MAPKDVPTNLVGDHTHVVTTSADGDSLGPTALSTNP